MCSLSGVWDNTATTVPPSQDGSCTFYDLAQKSSGDISATFYPLEVNHKGQSILHRRGIRLLTFWWDESNNLQTHQASQSAPVTEPISTRNWARASAAQSHHGSDPCCDSSCFIHMSTVCRNNTFKICASAESLRVVSRLHWTRHRLIFKANTNYMKYKNSGTFKPMNSGDPKLLFCKVHPMWCLTTGSQEIQTVRSWQCPDPTTWDWLFTSAVITW